MSTPSRIVFVNHGLYTGWKLIHSFGPFTTPSTIPEHVDVDMWKSWTRAWRRIRNFPDKRLEMSYGLKIPFKGTNFQVRICEDSAIIQPDGWIYGDVRVQIDASKSNNQKPYVRAGDMQQAMEFIIVHQVNYE